ncbi:hypothetical protein VFPFJ_05860 [Purpureocillium lilacinum]|uniref:Uncharacterized protein n=1 Tax=Purpureocillium lilacinum TaxID=33203 RepID=A0A179HIQ2_PURLI|nr:hypothetical protein VFPFJ_05860 [Purpureocillium lilacinum]OAQ89451.1 hypothetical protein VFPFJ_05860 [Purpureocillium lilacinum]
MVSCSAWDSIWGRESTSTWAAPELHWSFLGSWGSCRGICSAEAVPARAMGIAPRISSSLSGELKARVRRLGVAKRRTDLCDSAGASRARFRNRSSAVRPGEAQPPRVNGAQPACKKRGPRSSFIYCNNTNFEAGHDVLSHAIPSSALCIRARALHNFPYNSTHIELPPQEPLHDLDLRHAGADLQDLLPEQSHLVLVQDIAFEDCGKHIRRICGGTARFLKMAPKAACSHPQSAGSLPWQPMSLFDVFHSIVVSMSRSSWWFVGEWMRRSKTAR